MALSTGTRVGTYEILAVLGAGGMGEVYRARDTQLKRDVALKFLPPAMAADPDRLARFQREAEILASLNHTNIAHLYGLAEARLRVRTTDSAVTRPSWVTTGLSTAAESSRAATVSAWARVSRTAPWTWGEQRSE